MTNLDDAARTLAEAIGCGLAVLAAKPWHSSTFTGQRLLVEADADLPANVEQIDATLPGFALADLAQITARRAEVLLVAIP